MPSALPLADPAPPRTGCSPRVWPTAPSNRDLGVYLHVPFCRVRCGYCDFNTYTADEVRGVKRSDFADQAIAELDLPRACSTMPHLPPRPVSTVFSRRRHPDDPAAGRPGPA